MPLLAEIRDAITYISGKKYPTCSMAIPLAKFLEIDTEELQPVTKIGLQFQQKLLIATDLRYKNIINNEVLRKATILDPR